MSAPGSLAPETGVSAFPWDAVLMLGLSGLRWRPRDLWAATPRELAAAAGLFRPRSEALGRADLDRLIAAHPDPTSIGPKSGHRFSDEPMRHQRSP